MTATSASGAVAPSRVDARTSLVACAEPHDIAKLEPDPDLDAFRPAHLQLAALVDIAKDPRGCVTIAVADDGRTLAGYVAFHPPSPIETWADDRSGALIELGAVEVASSHRGSKLAERLLAASFEGGRFEHTVVFATLYRWHYDLERTGLGELGYRRMLERLYASAGFEPVATTDPEITSHRANRLMVRVGSKADQEVVAEFERLRRAHERRW